MPDAELLPGTLDLLILKSVSLGPQHGYGVLLRIQQITGQALKIEQGALYPALYKLETRGDLASEWGTSENNRRAKFYALTASGRKRFEAEETGAWTRLTSAMEAALEGDGRRDLNRRAPVLRRLVARGLDNGAHRLHGEQKVAARSKV